MPDVSRQTIEVRRGEDAAVPLAPLAGPAAVAGWSLLFTVKPADGSGRPTGSPLLSLSTPAGVVVTDAAAGLFSVVLTAAQTAGVAAGRYGWDVWRTDAGSHWPLAGGPFVVREPVRPPP